MKPDTSRWRDARSYDHFDDLSVEGLAWECLRRDPAYQQAYRQREKADQNAEPLDKEGEKRWGLRFRGGSDLVSCRADDLLVAEPQPCRRAGGADPDASWLPACECGRC